MTLKSTDSTHSHGTLPSLKTILSLLLLVLTISKEVEFTHSILYFLLLNYTLQWGFIGFKLGPEPDYLYDCFFFLGGGVNAGFLSLEEIDEGDYGLEIPGLDKKVKKERKNKSKKQKDSDADVNADGVEEEVEEEEGINVEVKKKRKKRKKKKKAKESSKVDETTSG